METKRPAVKKYLIIAGAVLGVIFMLWPYLIANNDDKTGGSTEEESSSYYSELLEKKLTELVESARGVGDASIMISLDSATESVFAQNESDSGSTRSNEHVTVSNGKGEDPVLVKEIYPKIRGVAIVCDGGGNAEVRNRVTELVSAALGISANKIAVSG